MGKRALVALAATLYASCTAEVAEPWGEGQGAEPELARIESALTDAPAGGGFGAVFVSSEYFEEGQTSIKHCTGFLMGDSMVITASHCFHEPLGTQTSGPVSIKLSLSGPDGLARTCLTNSPTDSNGGCAEFRPLLVDRLVEGPYTADYDFAASFHIQYGSKFRNVTAADGVLAMYTGAVEGLPYVQAGRGCTSFSCPDHETDTMRYKTGTVRSIDSSREYFSDIAEGSRSCEGDSGGPYYYPSWIPIAMGVLSQATETTWACAKEGADELGNLFSPLEMLILSVWRLNRGFGPCQAVDPAQTLWTCN